jgi:sec-independent protein translocase protein TatA
MLGNIQDWIIVGVVALLLFGGAGKIPELFRNLGRALGEFRRGQVEIQKELEKEFNTSKQELASKPTLAESNGQSKPSAEEIEAKIRELQAQLDQLKREQGKSNS